MISSNPPCVTVVHSLPGRVRVRLSHAPPSAERVISAIEGHPGIRRVHFHPVTRSLLVAFDAHHVAAEEIALRVAFHLSLETGQRPVRLLGAPERLVLGESAMVAAAALAAALALRWLGGGDARGAWIDRLAGASTAWAVVDHAAGELHERGWFDPEVLSLVYLAAAFLRGNLLKAATITWATSFGRHLLELPPTGVEVRPLEITGHGDDQPRYELLVSPDTQTPEPVRFVETLQSLIRYGTSGGGSHPWRDLWDELRHVAAIHGAVLEGYGRTPRGIPMRFQ